MNRPIYNSRVIFCVSLATLAGLANAQPGGTYVSGLEHDPLGGATLGTPSGRKLVVTNIGSSGQDGVEIKLRTAFGGSASVDAQPFLSTNGARLILRRKGWDGLIYGTHRVVSNGNGTATFQFDYTNQGATAVRLQEYDVSGILISDVTTPGPIAERPTVPNFSCPPGSSPVMGWQHVKLCNTCPWIDVFGWYCGNDFFSTNFTVATPILPFGVPTIDGIDSLLVTAKGMSSMAVSNAELLTYGAEVYGLGTATISETCNSPVGCTPAERRLPVHNLGSSGQDGVEIKLRAASSVQFELSALTTDASGGGGGAGGMLTSFSTAKASWNVKKNIRGRQASSPGFTELSFDGTELGSSHVTIATSVGGTPTGGGTGDPAGFRIMIDADWMIAHPFFKCTYNGFHIKMENGSSDDPMPAFLFDGITFTPVEADTITVTFPGAEVPDSISDVQITGSDLPSGFEIGALTWQYALRPCPADINRDSFVDDADFVAFAGSYDVLVCTDPAMTPGCPADLNGDGFVDDSDFVLFAAAYDQLLCP